MNGGKAWRETYVTKNDGEMTDACHVGREAMSGGHTFGRDTQAQFDGQASSLIEWVYFAVLNAHLSSCGIAHEADVRSWSAW